MEAGDSSVSVDLLLRALFALGAKPRDIANGLAASQTLGRLSCAQNCARREPATADFDQTGQHKIFRGNGTTRRM